MLSGLTVCDFMLTGFKPGRLLERFLSRRLGASGALGDLVDCLGTSGNGNSSRNPSPDKGRSGWTGADVRGALLISGTGPLG